MYSYLFIANVPKAFHRYKHAAVIILQTDFVHVLKKKRKKKK